MVTFWAGVQRGFLDGSDQQFAADADRYRKDVTDAYNRGWNAALGDLRQQARSSLTGRADYDA